LFKGTKYLRAKVVAIMANKLSLNQSMEYFNSLEPLLRTFWFIALPVSLIFVIQTILTFIGLDGGDGLDADFDTDLDVDAVGASQYFSLRNLINFLIGFSWTGVLFYDSIDSKLLLVGLALMIGILFLLFFFWAIKQIKGLAEDNTFMIEDTIGKTAEVYLPIPPRRMGKGKVLVSVNGSTRELTAATDELIKLKTGMLVQVASVENESILIVKEI